MSQLMLLSLAAAHAAPYGGISSVPRRHEPRLNQNMKFTHSWRRQRFSMHPRRSARLARTFFVARRVTGVSPHARSVPRPYNEFAAPQHWRLARAGLLYFSAKFPLRIRSLTSMEQ